MAQDASVPAHFGQPVTKVAIPMSKKHDLGNVLGRRAAMTKSLPKEAPGRVCIAPVWPKSLSIAPVLLKNALGVPFCRPEEFRTHLCSQYRFSVYPAVRIAIGYTL